MNYIRSLPLVFTIARMKLKSEASKLFLSYLWWILEPMLFIAVFYTVFSLILQMGKGDFIGFLMVGKIPFLWFSKTVNSGAMSLVAGKSIMGQRDFPKHIFPYATVFENSIRQILVFVVMFGLIVLRGYFPEIIWLWFIPIVIVNLMLILLLTMICSLLVVWMEDIKILVSMITVFLMFSSGIFWDVRELADVSVQNLILTFNPIAFLIDAYRQVLLNYMQPDLLHLSYLTLFILVSLILVHFLYIAYSQSIAAKALS